VTNKTLLSLLFSSILLIFGLNTQADAHVVDEVRTKSAQSDYEDTYTLVAQYKGEKSGVTFESYSSMWKTTDKLKQLEAELLKNKHGEELALLGKVVIIPNSPAGENVLGEYMANYKFTSTNVSLLSNRTIYLFGGNDNTTIASMAYTLSHEYGHHFSFYQLLNRENKMPGTWKSSQYAASRGVQTTTSPAHDKPFGEYIWALPEIMAEDYVQLFGSDTAIKESAQMNVELPTTFDVPTIQQYWNKFLPGFEPKSELPFYLTGYEVNSSNANMYNLQLLLQNLNQKPTYVHATEGSGTYASVRLDTIKDTDNSNKWYNYRQLTSDVSWILDKTESETMRLTAIQHSDTGFNRGSKSLQLYYKNLASNVTKGVEVFKDTKVYNASEIKTMLREIAVENGIPPEILKAIAYNETVMQQYNSAGQPNISSDGGIGIMQVTLPEAEAKAKGIDLERLKWDTRYNIQIGAKILKEKWDNPNLPKINDKNPSVVADWYFTIMTYNGLSKRNDPTIYGAEAYQEKVIDTIRKHSLFPITYTETQNINISYPYPDKPDIMVFVDSQYKWPNLNEKSRQMWSKGKMVYSWNNQLSFSNLRNGVNSSVKMQLPHFTPLEIIAGPFEVAEKENHYSMYQVKGNGFEGYISSSNIMEGNVTLFKDVTFGESASAITYLQLKKIISGYPDGTFKPNQALTRRQAASMLVKELGLTLPEGYKMKATDMKPGDANYREMAIVEAHCLMGRNGTLNPKGNLTRAQMAQIMVEAYGNIYKAPVGKTSFTDVATNNWSYDYINTLAYNKITVTSGGEFRPNGHVTRSQFSLFLMRTMEKK
jgi:soluble lytic murein transglycosylase-like protein